MFILVNIIFFSKSCFYSSSDTKIEIFEAEYPGVCEAMMKRHDEMTEADALKNKYRRGRVPFANHETNKNEYVYVISFSPSNNF
jgi:hypothetical protein